MSLNVNNYENLKCIFKNKNKVYGEGVVSLKCIFIDLDKLII